MVAVDGDDELGGDIEIATIELASSPQGVWSLQYVSHPAQNRGLTKAIFPCESDFAAFLDKRALTTPCQELTPLCAQELDAMGVGPLASLNLRPDNSAPVVPSKEDLAQLRALTVVAIGEFVST